MSNASLGWSVNDKEVLQSFQKMQGELDKQRQKIAQLEGASKKANDTWAAGLRTISSEQKRVAENNASWSAGLDKLRSKYDGLRTSSAGVASDSSNATKSWAAGLKTISEQQKPIIEGQKAWSAGLKKISDSYKAASDSQKANALSSLRLMTQSKAASDSWSDSLLRVGTNTSAVGAATTALTTVVAIAVQQYEDWKDKVTELGRAQSEVNRLMQSATFGGAKAPTVEAALRNVPGVSDADAVRIFESVKREAPQIPTEQQLQITETAARQAAVGVPVDKVGTFAGAMAELSGKLPTEPLERIADITTNLQRMTGEKFAEVSGDEFQRVIGELQKTGVSGESAIAFATMARNADLNTKTMESVALKLPRVPGATGEEKLTRLLSDERLQRRVLGKDFDVRLNALSEKQLSDTRSQLLEQGTFERGLSPKTEAAARTTVEQFTKEFSKESAIQRERADIGFARERLREFYEGAGLPQTQIEGVRIPLTSTRVGGKLQVFDAATGTYGIDPEQAAIAQLKSELKNAGPPTTQAGIENQKNALRLIELLEKIEANQRKSTPKNINQNVE